MAMREDTLLQYVPGDHLVVRAKLCDAVSVKVLDDEDGGFHEFEAVDGEFYKRQAWGYHVVHPIT